VTFRYKNHPDDATQFGLLAEEVEQVMPELVPHDGAGPPETVMYHELPAMLSRKSGSRHRRRRSASFGRSSRRSARELRRRSAPRGSEVADVIERGLALG
jgi:hypothetical protein